MSDCDVRPFFAKLEEWGYEVRAPWRSVRFDRTAVFVRSDIARSLPEVGSTRRNRKLRP